MRKTFLFVAALLGVASAAQAGAGVSFGFTIPLGSSAAPVYQSPAPVYQAPAPVYQTPAPVYEAPVPVYPPLSPVYQSAPIYAAPAPVISLGFGFGGFNHWGGQGRYHGGWTHNGHHGHRGHR